MSRADKYTELTNPDELYSDFLVNLNPHPVSGAVLRFTNEKAVTRSIRNLLLTNPGERLYQPDLGSGIRQLLFEPISDFTTNTLGRFIEDTISKYEQRAKVLAVNVIPEEDKNRYTVTIVYVLINKQEPVSITVTLQRVR
jgi:phage baseplate assembly protein W